MTLAPYRGSPSNSRIDITSLDALVFPTRLLWGLCEPGLFTGPSSRRLCVASTVIRLGCYHSVVLQGTLISRIFDLHIRGKPRA